MQQCSGDTSTITSRPYYTGRIAQIQHQKDAASAKDSSENNTRKGKI